MIDELNDDKHSESGNDTKPFVKRRVAVVECCWQCPFHVHDDQRDEAKWGKSWCEKMNVEVFDAEQIIDEACPLPFA